MQNISIYTMNENQLNSVSAGTFDKNHYPQWVYERSGFICNYHFFARDEFIMNGKVYNEDEANAIMASMGYSKGIKPGEGKKGRAHTIFLCKGERIFKNAN